MRWSSTCASIDGTEPSIPASNPCTLATYSLSYPVGTSLRLSDLSRPSITIAESSQNSLRVSGRACGVGRRGCGWSSSGRGISGGGGSGLWRRRWTKGWTRLAMSFVRLETTIFRVSRLSLGAPIFEGDKFPRSGCVKDFVPEANRKHLFIKAEKSRLIVTTPIS